MLFEKKGGCDTSAFQQLRSPTGTKEMQGISAKHMKKHIKHQWYEYLAASYLLEYSLTLMSIT